MGTEQTKLHSTPITGWSGVHEGFRPHLVSSVQGNQKITVDPLLLAPSVFYYVIVHVIGDLEMSLIELSVILLDHLMF